ncbi:hypothetical protein [Pseudomonas sp. NBRC 111124]|uniref:hypothetical protein n=1 Tax=Pseudomonas sp. NBRC 111124 TaxID=1661039 RepID=UPI000B12D733|nr:hypothetical protein [Pseudomonas sp. NBRC 111124]
MSSSDRKSTPISVSADPEIEAAEQGMYFLQEPGKQFREGQSVSYEVGIDEQGRLYAFNVRIEVEPPLH